MVLQHMLGLVEASASEWVSCKGRKSAWTSADVECIAQEIHDSLPAAVRQVILNGDWNGHVVDVEEHAPVTREDVVKYALLLKPFCRHYPDTVPSVYVMGDCLLALDRKFDRVIFKTKSSGEPMSRDDQFYFAANEGHKLKRLLQHLRKMFRDWPSSYCAG